MRGKILIVLFIIVVALFSSGITYSIFSSGVSSTMANQRIAKFIFEAEKADNIEISLSDFKPGDVHEYLFAVTNTRFGITSDITINYELTIRTMHFMPIDIELYKLTDTEPLLIMNCVENRTRNSSNEVVCNSSIQEMTYSQKTMDNYKLVLTFPSRFNGVEYSNLVDYLDIDISSWQRLDA